ncbi:MAG TPA: metal-dependent hydrolase [Bryobacteraceae bacterium]|nr:metal-dependent hydrolase [Bryobacteraceae bacterium]
MVTITWLGHSSFSLRLESGEVTLIDPWFEGNPKFPAHYKLDRVDSILITHGHFDHITNVRSVAAEYQPQIFANFEIAGWLTRKGVANCTGMNKGGRVALPGGLGATMTHALHSSGITEEDGSLVYGGEAGGFILHLPDGRNAYFAGDTEVFAEMAFLADLHAPQLAFLPIGDLYTMGPRGAALAARLLGFPEIIPMHYGTFPPLTGTPAELAALTESKVIELIPGVEFTW